MRFISDSAGVPRYPSWLLPLLAMLAVMLALGAQARANDIERVIPGVVKIVATVDGRKKTGTGFVVARDANLAYIVTAAHVVEGDNRPEVELYARQNDPLPAELRRIEGDNPRGLALLVLRNVPGSLPALELADSADLKRGDEVTAIGFPSGGGQWAVVRAYVSARDGLDWTLAGQIDEGNSGGPVIKGGKVVGLVTSMQGNFGRASPAQLVRLALEGWGVSLRAASSSRLKSAAPVERAAVSPEEVSPANVNAAAVRPRSEADKLSDYVRSVVKIRADRSDKPVDKLADGRVRHLYSVWIDAPEGALRQIDHVQYHYNHSAFDNPRTRQSDAHTGFKDSYVGIGAVNADMNIVVTLKNGTQLPLKFNMWQAVFGN